MKRKVLTALLLSVSCAPLVSCATKPHVPPSEQVCEPVYTDVVNDSTESLRQNLTNNKALLASEPLQTPIPR